MKTGVVEFVGWRNYNKGCW